MASKFCMLLGLEDVEVKAECLQLSLACQLVFRAGIRCLVIELVSTCIQTIPQCNTAYLEVWSHECSMNSMSRDVNATPLHGPKPCRLFTNVLGSCTEGLQGPALVTDAYIAKALGPRACAAQLWLLVVSVRMRSNPADCHTTHLQWSTYTSAPTITLKMTRYVYIIGLNKRLQLEF